MTLDWAKSQLFILLTALALPLCADDAKPAPEQHPSFALPKLKEVDAPAPASQNGYTINYNTVSIIEYLRFASKICNVNFIYNEAELTFNVSVVSDAPITPENVMATLVQVLRINGLMILEQDNNLVIHRSTEVNQIATIVTSGKQEGKSPIVTRIFRLRNAKPDSIATIIRPMISAQSILETSIETRQLILTDVTVNVDKVAALIEILDSPHTPLEIKSYATSHNGTEFLISLTNQIMQPIAQGNPFILVAQPMSDTVFVVSTPELANRAIAVMSTLDTPPKKEILSQRKLKSENVFVYKAEYRSGSDILKGLSDIGDNLANSGLPEGDLVETIRTARFIPETNSIMFFGASDSIAKVKEFLTSLDVPSKTGIEKSSFFVYRPVNRSAAELQKAILEMADNLKGTKGAEESLIDAIQSVKINPTTNTLVFSGEEKNFPRIKDLLSTIDTPTGKTPKAVVKNDFFLYKVQHASSPEFESSLKNFAKNLTKSNASDEGLIETIDSMKFISETNSFLFTGPDPSLKRLQEIAPAFDAGITPLPVSNQFLIYKPKYQKGEQISSSLKEIESGLKSERYSDPAFLHALESMKWIKANNSLLFTGDSASMKKVEDLIATVDVAGPIKPTVEKNFFLFHPQYASKEKTESYLKQVGDNLHKKGEDDLVEAIRSMKWIEPSQSFMFQGTQPALNRLKDLLQSFDNPTAAAAPAAQKGFFLYHLQYVSQSEMEEYLNRISNNLEKSDSDPDLVATIQSMKWVEPSRSFMFQGSETSLSKLKDLIQSYDSSSAAKPAVKKGFFLYRPQYVSKQQMQDYLNQVSDNLKKKGGEEDLVATIQSMKWVDPSQSYMFQGNEASIARLKDLLATFDTAAAAKPAVQKGFFLYHLQYASQQQMQDYLNQVSDNLAKKGGEEDLVATIQSMKWVEPSHSYMFQGSEASIAQLKDLISSFDTTAAAKHVVQKGFFLYHLQYVSQKQMQDYLNQVSDNLAKKGGEEDLVATIQSMKWVEPSHSYMFQGSEASIAQLKDLIASFDTAAAAAKPAAQRGFFLYHLQYVSQKQMQDYLNQVSDNLAKKGGQEDLVATIQSMKWVEPSHSYMFQGSEASIAQLKDLISSFDTAAAAAKPAAQRGFFLYHLQYVSQKQMQDYLNQVSDNLAKKGGQEDLVATIQSMKWVEPSHSYMFQGSEASIAQLKDLISSFDTAAAAAKPAAQRGFFLYHLQYVSQKQMQDYLNQVSDNLAKKGGQEDLVATIQSMKWVEPSHSYMFQGSEASIAQLKNLISSFDTAAAAAKPAAQRGFFLYHLQYVSQKQMQDYLNQVSDNLAKKGGEEDLVATIQSMKWVEPSHSYMFQGSEASIAQLKDLISSFDTAAAAAKPAAQRGFFLYHLQYVSQKQMQDYLNQVSDNLAKKGGQEDLVATIQSMKWVEPSHSYMFQGSEASIAQLKDLIASFDTTAAVKHAVSKGFFLYHPQYVSQQQTQDYLNQVSENLAKKGGQEDLVATIQSMKWVEPSHSYMFQGSEASIAQLKDLLAAFDTSAAAKPAVQKGFFLYHLQYVTQQQMQEYLNQVSDNLAKKGGEEDLVAAIRSMKWIDPSQSYMFQGNEAAISRLKELLQEFDTLEEKRVPKPKPGYYIYKLQNTTGDVIEEDLNDLAKSFIASGMKDNKLVEVIDNMRYVKETNSLLLTGDPAAIEEVKKLIAEYDYARTAPPKGPVNSNFLMYKPQHVPAAQIEKSLRDIGANLKKAELADPALLSAIGSSKYVETTNSLIFTGTPDALQKVQSLISNIDIPPQKHAPIQHIGKTTFLLYKLKNAGGPQILAAIKNMTSDLKKSGTSDKDFVAALQSVKFIKETDSLLFTGTDEALAKVEAFIEKFDVTSLATPTTPVPKPEIPPPPGPSNFYVYKPVSLSGPDLEKIMIDFADNLKMGGLADPDLFNAIASMRWIPKTQSLVFTGTTKSLDEIKQLLIAFDIPSNLPEGPVPGGGNESSIQAIDNTSFLVYKLQFHKGDEIQGALRQIAKDLIISNAPVNQNLLNSINSIQWLEVTNSILCSGNQETLTRLRELIKNLDIPLKQVFIEMLVIETSLTNALQFGLEWGGNYKYRNKFAGSVNNIAPAASGTSCTIDPTMTALKNLVPSSTTTPTPQMIPFGCNFNLGVIGQVIKHNGQTYLTLGSLLNAVQSDSETSIIVTPKIITQDGRTSSIFQGFNIPFVGSFVNNQGQTTVQTSNLEYRDIGLNLTVTPVLGNSDIVTLDIALDRTETLGDVTGSALNFSTTSAQGVTTTRTTMQTTVHVPDKNFLILSGFVTNSNAKVTTGIPCLGGLPIIGAAFSSDSDTINNTNLVIFLRPHIINSVDDIRRITAEQEDAFRDQQGTPFLLNEYNEGMELIKTVDDE